MSKFSLPAMLATFQVFSSHVGFPASVWYRADFKTASGLEYRLYKCRRPRFDPRHHIKACTCLYYLVPSLIRMLPRGSTVQTQLKVPSGKRLVSDSSWR